MTKPSILTIDLEGHPGEYITVPLRLGSRGIAAVTSRGHAGDDEAGNPKFDPFLMAGEAAVQHIVHRDASWNLKDEGGSLRQRTRDFIENDPDYAQDFIMAGAKILAASYAGDTSAEGNAEEPGSEPDEKPKSAASVKPTAKA